METPKTVTATPLLHVVIYELNEKEEEKSPGNTKIDIYAICVPVFALGLSATRQDSPISKIGGFWITK